MPALPLALIADLRVLVAAWTSVRGGWRAAWRDAEQVLARRRILVETPTRMQGGPVVLRTRVRLSGDVQTDVCKPWLTATPRPAVEALTAAHFKAVADAMRGWAAVGALVRIVRHLLVVLGSVYGVISAVQTTAAAGWRTIVPSLLTDWRVLLGITVSALGFAAPRMLRLWLRWRFRNGLALR